MPNFTVTAPDGKVYSIDGPEGATEEDAVREVKKQLGEPPSWGEVGGKLRELSSLATQKGISTLGEMSSSANIEDRRNLSEPGFAESRGGAVTGLVRPKSIEKQTEKLAQDYLNLEQSRMQARSAGAELKAQTPANMTFWQQAAVSAAQSAPSTLAGLTVGLVSPAAGLALATAGGGSMQAASTYEQAKAKGVSEQEAQAHAGIDAILEAVGEGLGIGALLKPSKRLLGKIFTAISVEAGQEAATQVMQDLHARLSYEPDKSFQDIWNDMKLAAASGALMGGALAPAAHVLTREPEPIETERALTERLRQLEKNTGTNNEIIQPQKTTLSTPTPTPEQAALIAGVDATLQSPETITEQEAEEARQKVAGFSFDKLQAESTLKPETEAKLGNLDELLGQEVGESTKVRNNQYLNPNDDLPRRQRVAYLTPEGVQSGYQLRSTDIVPGVYVIGEPTLDRPDWVLKGLHEQFSEWAAKYLPDSTFFIMNESQKTGSAAGWHGITNTGVHVITPSVIRSMKDSQAFNANTEVKLFYNAAHEFGHALMLRFFEGVAPEVTAAIRESSRTGLISEQLIAQTPELVQAVLREYNQVKARIPEMNAQQFVNEWQNPWKVGKLSISKEHGVHPEGPATQYIAAQLRRAIGANRSLSASQLRQMQADFLSIDEYIAEQNARFAYERGLAEKSPFKDVFRQAFASMRAKLAEFFKEIKQEGILRPGTRFADWLDSLTMTPAEVQQLIGKRKVETKKAKKIAKVKTPPAQAPPINVEPVDHNVETSTTLTAAEYRELLRGALEFGGLKRNSPLHRELSQLLKAKDYSTFIEKIQPILEKNVRFELDDIPEVHQMGLQADTRGLVRQLGQRIYVGDLPGTIIKEMVQNAFDAVKAQRNLLSDAEREIYTPKIDVTVDPVARSVTVTDNGVGMTPEIIQKALLTYPGTSKTGLKPEERSGGLGMAKFVILFEPISLHLESVRDGKRTVIDTNPEEILSGGIQARVSETNEPSGTIFQIVMPEYVERAEGRQKVEMPTAIWNANVLYRGIIDPDLQATFHNVQEKKPRPVDNQPDYPLYKTMDFSWGIVEIYTDGKESSYGISTVYSSGLYQFDTTLKVGNKELPLRTALNIKPHVDASDIKYPFENNRQGLKQHVGEDIGKVVKDLVQLIIDQRLQKALKTYSNIEALPLVRWDEVTPSDMQLSPIQMQSFEKDGKPNINIQLEKVTPLFHNNTVVNWIEEYPGSLGFFSKVGTWMADWITRFRLMERQLGKVQEHIDFPRQFLGVGIDKELYGVNVRVPYHAILVNPLAGNIANNPDGIAEEIYQTFIHEVAHNYADNHDADFANKLAAVAVGLSEFGFRSEMINQLADIVAAYHEQYLVMRERFNESSTENVGDSIEGTKRFIEGYSRDADTFENLPEEEGSEVSRNVRRGGPQADIHFELDGFGEPTGFGLRHAADFDGRDIDAAAGEWKRLGFGSRWFKAWFGDWQGDKEKASKVMTASGSQPLVLAHGTRMKVKTARGMEPFTEFQRGDIGFHFGTVRAAMTRLWGPDSFNEVQEGRIKDIQIGLEGEAKQKQEPGYIIPVVLNIRNPLYLGEEDPDFWNSPYSAVKVLVSKGVISSEVATRLHRVVQDYILTYADDPNAVVHRYNEMKPVRDFLFQGLGFDGIKYENTIEGDTSWVAFFPEQIKSVLNTGTFDSSPRIHWELDFDESTPEGENAAKFTKQFKPFFPNWGPFRRALRWVQHLPFKTLELQQLAHLNPDLPDITYMADMNMDFTRHKSSLQAGADRNAFAWADLGKEDDARVRNFLTTELDAGVLLTPLSKDAEGRWVYGPSEAFYTELKKFGINPDIEKGQRIAQLILDLKNSILNHVNQAEETLAFLLQRRYAAAPIEIYKAARINLSKRIHEIRQRPFFPRGVFGNFVLVIEKKRVGKPGYDIVHREGFENETDWEKAWLRAQRSVKEDERIRKEELTDSEYVLMSLPQDFIELAASELGLSDDQVEHLLDILQPVRVEKALKSYDLARLGIKGYSKDLLRSYAHFMWHNANMLAKLRYRSEFNLAIRGISKLLREAKYDDSIESMKQVRRLTQIRDYMQRATDYIMSPPNEAHMARAFVALGYLWLNVKTAALNVFSFIFTWSDVTSKMGQVKGNMIMLKALAATMQSLKLTDLNVGKQAGLLSAEKQASLDRAIQEGVLTQSYAYHLAGMANQSNLYRLPATRLLSKVTRQTIDLGMYAFRLTELGIRRATFLAQLDIEMQKKDTGFTDAYTNAVRATNLLQNEYSLGNRVPFMRGKTKAKIPLLGELKLEGFIVPMATIFMSFTQFAMFHSLGGYQLGLNRKHAYEVQRGLNPANVTNPAHGYTIKVLLLLLVLAGYEGLPLMENLLDIFDLMWKKWYKRPLRQDLRELVQAAGGDPILASRGLGHNVFGFDISRSVGFGRAVPGTDVLMKSTDDPTRQVGTMVFDMAGPAGNMLQWMLETGLSDKPFGEQMKRTPGAVGNIITAYHWSQDGVRAPSGAVITKDPNTGQIRDLSSVEIFGKALGFNPTVVSENREIIFKQHDAKMYWSTRRARLLDDLWRAEVTGDREAIADARKAVTEFNNEIPEDHRFELRISPKEISQSRIKRLKTKRLEEQGLAPQRRYRGLYKGVRESFEH